MIVFKKEPSMAPYARKEDYEYEGKQYEADIKNGDTTTIKNAGDMVKGQFGDQYEFLISTRNGDRLVNMNQSSINILHDSFGADTNAWVGKEVTVLTKKDVVANKKVIIAYFVTNGWFLDDFGDLEKQSAPSKVAGTNVDYPESEYQETGPGF